MAKKTIEQPVEKIEDIKIEQLMGSAFGEYSKSIIQDRAIPDARDGLKPVQRRIIYAMNEDGNTYNKPYKKSIKGVSAVMSQYHPHGDSSIYEAMIRLGQSWKNNFTMVDIQGNGGSIDGDGPAASRYVETRLSKNASLFVDDLPFETVDTIPNFDDTKYEPVVLPCKVPMGLVMGSTGIAAGYATDIPPFNLNEVVDCTLYRLKHKRMSIDDVMNFIKGPDFPTGGFISDTASIRHCMETGKGKIINSCKYEIVEGKKLNQIVITEIPFDVSKQDIVKQVNELNNDFILECRDESDKEGIRVVIDVDSNVDIKTAVRYVLKNSNFQKNYNFNMVSIINKKPVLCGVLPIIDAWIEFRKDVVVRRTKFLLNRYKNRKEIVEGLIKAVSILDKVIKCIRASKDRADVIKNLQKEFGFTEAQATAIADMRLHRLSNTDIVALKTELEDLNNKIKELEKILSSENEVVKVIEKELKYINKEFVTPRLTKIMDTNKDIEIDETKLIQNEDVYVIVTKDGYLKRLPVKNKDDEQSLKTDDEIVWSGVLSAHDLFSLFTDNGGYLTLSAYKVPACKSKDIGTHISKFVKNSEGSNVIFATNKTGKFVAFSRKGMIKTFESSELVENVKLVNMPAYFKLRKDDIVGAVKEVKTKHLITVTKDGYVNLYKADEVTPTALNSLGLQACKIKKGDELADVILSDDDEISIKRKKVKAKDIDSKRGLVGKKIK